MFDLFFPRRRASVPSAAVALQRLFSGCDDFQCRSVAAGTRGGEALLCWLEGCVSSDALAETVLRPLSRLPGRTGGELLEAAARGGVFPPEAQRRTDPGEAAADLAAGCAALLFPATEVILTLEVKSAAARAVDTPAIEKSVLGPKDAFVETLRVNFSLLRRRAPTPSLKLRQVRLGRLAPAAAAVFYMEGPASPAAAAEVLRRLEKLDVPGLTAAGELERALCPPPRGVFPRLVHTERPDRFLQGLLAGKIGVLCDGLPVGFLLPAGLGDLLFVGEDRSRHALVAAALLALRYLALGIALLLPAVYVAAAMYHPEMIPAALLRSLIRAKEAVPFSTPAEVLGMLLSFELLQEAGIRLPEPVGQTVSVIGALIVGQSAVEAKVLSPIVIIVVAAAGIGGYAQPSQELAAAVRLWRLALVLLSAGLGLFGAAAGCMVLLWRLCDTEDMGLCYLRPLCGREEEEEEEN